jgi:hypothetical protein
MKIIDIIKEAQIPSSKPRNFVAKNAAKTTSGAGKHKDKKKAAKQGDVKHKGKISEGPENLSIGQQMARDGITYSPEKERELIKIIGEYMEKAGMSPKAIRYYLSHDEDFVSDQLEYLPRKGVAESATAGATSAANVSVGAVYPNKKGKTPKNKNGTAKNALDMKANLMTGGSIKR